MTALRALPVLFTALFFYTYCDMQSYVLINCVCKIDYLNPLLSDENNTRMGNYATKFCLLNSLVVIKFTK
jgi:hypothetical protein